MPESGPQLKYINASSYFITVQPASKSFRLREFVWGSKDFGNAIT